MARRTQWFRLESLPLGYSDYTAARAGAGIVAIVCGWRYVMRGYAKISPQFWIGDTGRKLRDAGQEAMLVGLYLLSNPHANMLGLYYLPKLFIAHETGLGLE